MTLFQIILIVVVSFMPMIIVFLYNKVRDLELSNARAFKYIEQVKRDLATLAQVKRDLAMLIQANTDNLTKQVRCSDALTKRLNNLEDAIRHNRRPSKSKHNAPAKN